MKRKHLTVHSYYKESEKTLGEIKHLKDLESKTRDEVKKWGLEDIVKLVRIDLIEYENAKKAINNKIDLFISENEKGDFTAEDEKSIAKQITNYEFGNHAEMDACLVRLLTRLECLNAYKNGQAK